MKKSICIILFAISGILSITACTENEVKPTGNAECTGGSASPEKL